MTRTGRIAALLEVAAVFAAMIFTFRTLGRLIAGLPGSGPLLQLLVFTFGTMGLLLALRRKLGDSGITFTTIGPSFRLALVAFAVVGPTSMVFWLIDELGTSVDQWLGSAIVGVAFLVAGLLVAGVTSRLPTRAATSGNKAYVRGLLILLLMALVVSMAATERAPVLANLAYYVLIVGFSEEIAFRGYFQSRLNQALGRPWQWQGISFGPGLFLAAFAFGLAHTLAGNEWIWSRTLYTTVYGMILGLIREKDGSVLAPALLHGLADMPRAFVG